MWTLGLGYAKSTARDLEDIEADYLRKVADLREELEIKEKKVMTHTKDIETLEAKKEILELSIERASRILFIKSKKKEFETEINSILLKEKRLIDLIEQVNQMDKDLLRLGEEITTDANVEIINEIISKEGRLKRENPFNIFENLPNNPITALFVLFGRIANLYFELVFKLFRK